MTPSSFDFYNGEVILINKPYKWTSFDAVNKIRNVLKKIQPPDFDSTVIDKNGKKVRPPKLKVGHAGTLDPLATGLLIICTGKLTKQIDSYQAQEKEYTGTFFLGATTPSSDLETKVNETFPVNHLTNDIIHKTAKTFTGRIMQSPPLHSAVKIEGQRAYEMARRGEVHVIQPKEVEVIVFEITKIELPVIDFRVVCSKGTYIRSLASDFGKALNSGAYLASLCRTRIGNFKLDNALEIKQFIDSLE